MSYKGDSSGKKIARARLWIGISNLMTALRVPYVGSFVLAGEGGDVSVLKALGYDPATIIAADIDEDYAEFCKELHPDITVVIGEAGKVAPHIYYNAAHLDFCNGLTIENIKTVADVVRNAVCLPCAIGVTMMKGREVKAKQNNMRAVVNLPSRIRRLMLKDAKKLGSMQGAQLLKNKTFDPKLEIQLAENHMRKIMCETDGREGGPAFLMSFDSKGKLTPLGTAMARADALRCCVETLLEPYDIGVHIVNTFAYHSKNKHTAGTPFFSAVLMPYHPEQSEGLKEKINKLAHYFISYDSMSASDGEEWLRPYVLSLCAGLKTKEVAELFDIPASRIAAWRAHQTRGSYDTPKKGGGFKVQRVAGAVSTGWGVIGITDL